MNTFPKESAKDTGENAAVVIGAKLQTRDGSLSVCLGGRRVGWVGEDRQRAKVIQRRRNKQSAPLVSAKQVVKETLSIENTEDAPNILWLSEIR